MHQDCGLAGAQLSSSACNNTVDARHKSAIAVAGEMSRADEVSVSAVLEVVCAEDED